MTVNDILSKYIDSIDEFLFNKEDTCSYYKANRKPLGFY